MPFIPHTEDEVFQMLSAIGVNSIEELFDEIPADLRAPGLTNIPNRASEMEVGRLIRDRAAQNGSPMCFIGAGAYEHHIPAAVWELTTRGEFYSAYTPYQAEASQGTLQLIYEFQTMMANLTGMDVSNASLYDGASAMAEAALMAVRLNRKSKSRRVLVPMTVNPAYRRTAHSIVTSQDIDLVELPYCAEGGHTIPASLDRFKGEDITAIVIQQPNFFGTLEEVDALTDWAHEQGAIVIAVVNPTTLALLTPPGEWGTKGADIVCGEGQPLGIPLSWGGPYFGFMCCKQAHARQMPGRIIGRTVDADGKPGFVLTLQAREQHIRRSKATSNICTNQGLMVTAATIYMSLLGTEGLERVALASHQNTCSLMEKLGELDGVNPVFNRPFFHETVVQLKQPVAQVLQALEQHNLQGGYDLSEDYPELGNALLINVTETKTEEDLTRYVKQMALALGSSKHQAIAEETVC
jgi:glycine dehydrogenase subunit 1